MTTIHAVLLIPDEDDPHKLLRGGIGGARPPVAVEWSTANTEPDEPNFWAPYGEDYTPRGLRAKKTRRQALMLAGRGKPTQEGLAWYRMRLEGKGLWWDDTARRVRAYLSGDHSAAYIVAPSLGAVILADELGREVQRVDA